MNLLNRKPSNRTRWLQVTMTWLMIKEQIILEAHMLICAFNTIQVTVNFYHLVSVQFAITYGSTCQIASGFD